MIDLHTHSSCSDGQHPPAELVALAHTHGITHLALTDHDTIAGLASARTAANACGMYFLSGIEISTSVVHQHLLGLGIEPTASALVAACAAFHARREQRLSGILNVLAEQGIHLQVSHIRAHADAAGQLGRPHIALEMVAQGYVPTVQAAFEQYLDTPAIHAVDLPKPDIAEAIALVHAAGGVAVLAHPMQLGLDFPALERHLDALREMGLDGVEAYYRSNLPQVRAFLCAYAHQHNLLVTGGSDFHGVRVKPGITLGIPTQAEILVQPALRWETPLQ